MVLERFPGASGTCVLRMRLAPSPVGVGRVCCGCISSRLERPSAGKRGAELARAWRRAWGRGA
eukprot:scaffold6057_cov112-Isochrysis_galbana.AAC.5